MIIHLRAAMSKLQQEIGHCGTIGYIKSCAIGMHFKFDMLGL